MVQTLDGGGRRNMYDPDELEDEQRERERRNKINNEFQQFVKRVQVGLWEQRIVPARAASRNVRRMYLRMHRLQRGHNTGMSTCDTSHGGCK